MSAAQTSWDDRGFRDALSKFATGVAVATCQVDGLLFGATVTSFNSVSLSPPLVLFSLARAAKTFDAWQKASHFAITVLGEHQSELSNRFARGGEDKWKDLTPRWGSHGTPALPKGLVTFECEVYARYDGGDHEIVVGQVLSFNLREVPPLLFFGGRYRRVQPEQPLETPPDFEARVHGW